MLPIEAMPEDYERLEKHWGLDKPLTTQYVIFITKALQGDFGQSLEYQGKSAMDLVTERLPATLELAGFALLISVILALPIGVLAAVAKGSSWDTAAKIVALLGQSLPAWRGIHFVTLFAEGGADEAPSSMATIPYVAPYPGEYRQLRPNLAALGGLAEETGGEVLDPESFSAGLRRLLHAVAGSSLPPPRDMVAAGLGCAVLFLADLVMRSWRPGESAV